MNISKENMEEANRIMYSNWDKELTEYFCENDVKRYRIINVLSERIAIALQKKDEELLKLNRLVDAMKKSANACEKLYQDECKVSTDRALKIKELEAEIERYKAIRKRLLDVQTTDNLSSSEWVERASVAEERVKEQSDLLRELGEALKIAKDWCVAEGMDITCYPKIRKVLTRYNKFKEWK